MNFQPLIDYVEKQGDKPTLETSHGGTLLVWTQKPMRTTDIDVNVNGPGYWSDDDKTWGITITTTYPGGEDQQSMSTDNLDDLITWVQKRLYPTERDLNEAWGV